MSTIKKFGNWVIDETGIIFIGNSKADITYPIPKERLWELRTDGTENKWEWPIHLVIKNWIDKNEMDNFIHSLKFSQDYFKHLAPKILDYDEVWENTIEDVYLTLRIK